MIALKTCLLKETNKQTNKKLCQMVHAISCQMFSSRFPSFPVILITAFHMIATLEKPLE